MNILCAICSDLVSQAENIYVTKCGHIFHLHCLSQWIERSKSCPQCRNKVTEKCMFRLYPTISNENNSLDAATLQSKLDDAQLQLRQERVTNKAKDDMLNNLKEEIKKSEKLINSLEQKLVSRVSAVSALTEQIQYLKIENKQANKLKEENETLKKNAQMLTGLQKVLNATSDEVEQMLQGYTDLKTIATFATALKRALCESESKKNDLRDKLQTIKQELAKEKHNVTDLQNKIVQLEDKLANTERKYEILKTKRKASEMSQNVPVEPTKEVKQPRRDVETKTLDLNTAIIGDDSFSEMVDKIEHADSPYLRLKQSCFALNVVNGAPFKHDRVNEPIDNMMRKYYKNTDKVRHILEKSYSIESPKHNTAQLDIAYDGFGGHSKLDVFPTPQKRPTLKTYVPKVTSKHKLKRPAPSGSQDIGKLFEKIMDNDK